MLGAGFHQCEIHRRERSSESLKLIISTNIKRNLRTGKQQNPCLISSSSRMSSQSSRSTSLTLSRSWYPSLGVGRSLGVHLILATQKPSGVVDDQIWSNSRFKIALKVADRSDSNEMLHTPDAAEITQTGRAYLQVGNNEVYELFQSAWSGADYQPDKDDMGIEDHTIYLINELGQYEILNEDLSGLEDVDEIKEVPTELDAIVHHIQLLCEEQEIPPVPQPWLHRSKSASR